MKKRPQSGTAAQRRSRMFGTIALTVGGVVGLARFADDWTRSLTGAEDGPLPMYRQLAIAMAHPFRALEWTLYDFVHAYGRKTPPDPDVVVLGIDEASLDLANSAFPEDIEASRALQLMNRPWPWSREVYAVLIDRLVEAGAETIVIDLMLPSASAEFPEGDALLREALDRHVGKVVLAADVVGRETGGEGEASTVETVHFPFDGLIAHQWPADERVGYVTYWPDLDGVIRQTQFRRHLNPQLPESLLHSFAAAALRQQGRGDRLPDGTGSHFVRFGDLAEYRPISLHEVFSPVLWDQTFANGGVFAGKTIFLGPVARVFQDFHPTPVGTTAGVRIHAQVYAAAKARSLVTPLPGWANGTLVAAGALLGWALLSVSRRPLLIALTLLGGLALGVVGQLLLFNHAGMWVPIGSPLLAYGLVGFLTGSVDFLLERRQKLALKRSVMRFHSPDIAEQIVEHPEHYYAIREGANRTIVVLFSDIRGYTSLSEVLTAQQMVAQLNEYFERMVDIVFLRRGAVDKFIGDAMMAVWGRFRDNPREDDLVDDACQAVDSALAMRASLIQLNAGWRARGMTELAIGIGLHQGDAVVGELGSQARTELTAIGDTVNLGSRLEGATKEYGLDLLISEPVKARVADRFHCRSVDLLRVKGKQLPVEVFAVLGPTSEPPPPALAPYEDAMSAYRHGAFTQAVALFQQAAQTGFDDDLTQLFINRCENLAVHPPDAWDGVFTMTKK
ncbi:MAG: CHASE2 domain-containing protein [Verrucomicrobiales bacterium]